MKEKLINSIKTLWQYANSHIGAVLIAGGITYIITKGSSEKELEDTREKLNQVKTRLNTKEEELSRLTDELRAVFRAKTQASFCLETCERRFDFLNYAHKNSWCFFRQDYSNSLDQRTMKPVSDSVPVKPMITRR